MSLGYELDQSHRYAYRLLNIYPEWESGHKPLLSRLITTYVRQPEALGKG